MTEHIVSAYEEELAGLARKIAQMGGLAEEAFANAIDALQKRDHDLARKVVANDKQLDVLERVVEEQAVTMIARRQPMARDLREIMVAIRIASDLERIGDLAKNIAKRTLVLEGTHPVKIIHGLSHMGRRSLEQVKNVLDAYSHRDAEKAREVWVSDEEIDDLYNSLFRELLTYMMEDPRNISICTHLLFGAKNIERIGDYATNVAENVYYMVQGENLADDRPKGDVTSSTVVDYSAK